MSNSDFRVKNNLVVGNKAANPVVKFENTTANGQIDYTASRLAIKPGAGTLELYAGDALRMYIDTDGNVHVGDAAGVSSGIRYFDVYNLASTTAASTAADFRLVTLDIPGTGSSSFDITKYRDGTAKILNFETSSAACILFGINNGTLEKMRICANGNIGVGITTPSSPLHIARTTSSGTYRSEIRLDNQDQRTTIASYYNEGVEQLTVFKSSQIVSGAGANGFTFESGSTSIVRMQGGGNVGIGNNNPAAKLHVQGNIMITGYSQILPDTTNQGLTISGRSTGHPNGGTIVFRGNDVTSGVITDGLELLAGGSCRMVVCANGNVGINKTDPGYTVDIEGNLRLNTLIMTATAYEKQIQWQLPSSRLVYFYGRPTDSEFGLYDSSLSTGASRWSTDTSGNFTAYGNVTAYSDLKLKTHITTIDNALDKVSRMRGVMFTRKDTGERGTGVIAQEMQEVMPEAVKDGDILSVSYGNLVGVLIEAIKELKAEIDYLKSK